MKMTLQKGAAKLRANVAGMNAAYGTVVCVRPAPAAVADAWADDIRRRREGQYSAEVGNEHIHAVTYRWNTPPYQAPANWLERYRALSAASGRRKPVLNPT
jgi:hypothetical protein